ncbi:MAG TPA: class I SAM-dependent methyltransferase [Vicinamibacterales bacterium]|nr:class I SAM-dependent methyltransferase [Vicinamibacterales bacterium]
MSGERVTDYDRVAARFDRRYALYEYAGTRDAVLEFVKNASDVLEVGCGTGHWVDTVRARAAGAAPLRHLVGVEPSAEMIARASGPRVRAIAEQLPFPDASFDRIFCVNALHHFTDRFAFFTEARRVLRPGGGVMTIGKDPHADRDTWWVYDHFPETREIDRARFAPVRILRGELARAGFSWAESFEADHIEVMQSAAEALATGVVDRTFTSQLSVLTDAEFDAGVARIRAGGDDLQLAADFHLFATVGWVG